VDLLEINEPFFYICVDELHLNPTAHIDALIPAEQSTFDRWMKDAHPYPLVGSARADCVELISDSRSQQHSRSGFGNKSFYLVGIIFLFCAVPG
jgi:hypothetical protein